MNRKDNIKFSGGPQAAYVPCNTVTRNEVAKVPEGEERHSEPLLHIGLIPSYKWKWVLRVTLSTNTTTSAQIPHSVTIICAHRADVAPHGARRATHGHNLRRNTQTKTLKP